MSDGLRFNTGTGTVLPIFGGRLTLDNGVPVMSTSQTAVSALYYAPYTSPYATIYNGTTVQYYQFTSSATDANGLSMSLGSNWAANSVHDVFVTLQSGVPVLCTIPWTNTTTRATALGMYSGFLTNAASATARLTNSSTFTLAANQGSYLGTIMTTGTAGQISFTFGSFATGGGAATFGVWNNYNRREVSTQVADSSTSWTYASTTVRKADNSTNNRVSFVVGLLEDQLSAEYCCEGFTSNTAGAGFDIYIGLNSTTSAVGMVGDRVTQYGIVGNPTAVYYGLPALGANYVQALENVYSVTVTFAGDGVQSLNFSLLM